MRVIVAALLTALSLILPTALYAEENFSQRKDVQKFIQEMTKKYHFNQSALNKIFRQAKYKPEIIEAMEKPYEKKPWDFYKKLFLTDQRVSGGLRFWQENQKTLERAEKTFGVPASVIVAIIGIETRYGQFTGNFRVLDALSTLAFHYPKRAPFFRKELGEYLLLCRANDMDPTENLGSYAGAMGMPQFMPSSYRFYAVDFSGNGKKDLLHNNEDVIGSVANYLHRHGWNIQEGVAEPTRMNKQQTAVLKMNTRKANYSLQGLQKQGIKAQINGKNSPKKAGVIALTTTNDKEYWLAYPNFYVITRYNTSPQYALAVHLLSETLRQQRSTTKT